MVEHTRESLIEKARELALRQDSPLTRDDFIKLTGISRYFIEQQFPDGGWRELSDLAGIPAHPSAHGRFSNEDLLVAFHLVAIKTRGIPSLRQFNVHSKFSSNAIIRRFGGISGIRKRYKEWLMENKPDSPYVELGATKSIHELPGAPRTSQVKSIAPSPEWSRQTTLKRSEVTEEANRPISNGDSEQHVLKKEAKEKGNYFRKDEDSWTISYEGRVITGVKDAKGLHYIAYLLQNPNKIVGVSELVTIVEKPLQDKRAEEFDFVNEETQDKLHIRRTSNLGDSGEVWDQQALQAFKKKVNAIEEDLLDPELTDKSRDELRIEKEKIEDEIVNAHYKGRPRKGGDVSERIRKAVTNRIQNSIKKITGKHPLLGKYLSDTIKTGSSCSYNPPIFIPWNS